MTFKEVEVNTMNTESKNLYEAPSITIVEVKQKGVICNSLPDPTDYNNGGNPFGA